MIRTSLLLLSIPVLAASPRLQDPPAPPGGFPIVEQLNQLLTYDDGYRTRYDLRMPDPAQVTPPATGWPLLLMVHGFSGARGVFTITGEGASYAQRGYVTVSYDVRGQGDAKSLNPSGGTTVTGPLEKADMVELFHLLEARLGSMMDFDRLCVMGTSQGGDHSFAAAGWSEKQLPQPRGPYTTFPKITAVCPRVGLPDVQELWLPDDNAFAGNFTRGWFWANVDFEPTFESQVQTFFLNQDFNGIRTWLQNSPWRRDHLRLNDTAVPVFYTYSWDDSFVAENAAVDAINTMPAATPRKVYLTTGDHRSPLNRLEQDAIRSLTERWLDRFAKGTADEIDAQPPFTLLNIPANQATATNPNSIWQLSTATTYPNTGLTTPTTLYLRQGGVLSANAPTGTESADRVRHEVPGSFTPSAWVATRNDPAQVFAAVPLSAASYRGAPLVADLELVGRAMVRLHIDSPAPNVQLHAAIFDENGAGQRRYITGGYRCIRGRAAGRSQYDIELRGTNYTFPAGHRVVLAVENHTWHRPIGISEIRTVPYFEGYAFDCLHNAAEASSLRLPTRPPAFGARPDKVALSAGAGDTVTLRLAGAAPRSGGVYAVLAGLSGTVPGFVFRGTPVPINFDALSSVGLSAPSTPPFVGFVGQLNGAGNATARFAPAPGLLPPAAVGLRLSFGAVVFEPGGGFAAAAANQVLIEP